MLNGVVTSSPSSDDYATPFSQAVFRQKVLHRDERSEGAPWV
jgi:hypothetical protein